MQQLRSLRVRAWVVVPGCLTTACPHHAGTYPDHFSANGANAIALYDLANCWVRNVSDCRLSAAAAASPQEGVAAHA